MSQRLCVGIKKTFCLDQSNCFGSLTHLLNWGRGETGRKKHHYWKQLCRRSNEKLWLQFTRRWDLSWSKFINTWNSVRGRPDPNHVDQLGSLEGPYFLNFIQYNWVTFCRADLCRMDLVGLEYALSHVDLKTGMTAISATGMKARWEAMESVSK